MTESVADSVNASIGRRYALARKYQSRVYADTCAAEGTITPELRIPTEMGATVR